MRATLTIVVREIPMQVLLVMTLPLFMGDAPKTDADGNVQFSFLLLAHNCGMQLHMMKYASIGGEWAELQPATSQ